MLEENYVLKCPGNSWTIITRVSLYTLIVRSFCHRVFSQNCLKYLAVDSILHISFFRSKYLFFVFFPVLSRSEAFGTENDEYNVDKRRAPDTILMPATQRRNDRDGRCVKNGKLCSRMQENIYDKCLHLSFVKQNYFFFFCMRERTTRRLDG